MGRGLWFCLLPWIASTRAASRATIDQREATGGRLRALASLGCLVLQLPASGAQLAQQIGNLGIDGRQHLRSPASRQMAATHAGRRGDAGDRLAADPALQELARARLQSAGDPGAYKA